MSVGIRNTNMTTMKIFGADFVYTTNCEENKSLVTSWTLELMAGFRCDDKTFISRVSIKTMSLND